MTVNDYISQKFQTFGINLSEADLLEISLYGEVHPLSIATCHFHQRERFLYVLGHQRSKGILLVFVQEVWT